MTHGAPAPHRKVCWDLIYGAIIALCLCVCVCGRGVLDTVQVSSRAVIWYYGPCGSLASDADCRRA